MKKTNFCSKAFMAIVAVFLVTVILSGCSENAVQTPAPPRDSSSEIIEYEIIEANTNFSWCITSAPAELEITSTAFSAYASKHDDRYASKYAAGVASAEKIPVCCAAQLRDGIMTSRFCSDYNRTLAIMESFENGQSAKKIISKGNCRIEYDAGEQVLNSCEER